MGKVSIRDLHIHTSRLVREAAGGDVIVIQRRGEPVAELRPLSASPGMDCRTRARIFASMERIWARLPQCGDSAPIIAEDRER